MDIETVRKVARLSRIEMSDAELGAAAEKLSNIMGWIEQLSEVDTDNVEPLSNVVNIPAPLRADEQNDGGIAEDVLKNAPEHMQSFFVVPKVVENVK